MAIYGYASVSSDGRTLAAQQAALAGCAKVYAEKVSGVVTDHKASIQIDWDRKHDECKNVTLSGIGYRWRRR